MPDPHLPFRQRVTLRLLSPALWFGLAALLMAVAFLVVAVGLVGRFDDKRAEDTCRSRIAGEVTQAQGEVTLAVGDGLAALDLGDPAARAQARADYGRAETHLATALEARERSEETCAR